MYSIDRYVKAVNMNTDIIKYCCYNVCYRLDIKNRYNHGTTVLTSHAVGYQLIILGRLSDINLCENMKLDAI